MDGDAPDSRERILAAAEHLFADLGFDATPTARVAELAGVPKGLIFHYFPRKVDLLAALARERAPRVNLAANLPRTGTDLAAALLAAARRLAYEHTPMHTILLRDSRRHPDVRAGLQQLYHQVTGQVREIIDKVLTGSAEVAPEARQAAAVTFTAALMHATHHRHLTGEAFDLSPVVSTIAAGLAPHPTSP
jgi:AcrR family transcriptional regulator